MTFSIILFGIGGMFLLLAYLIGVKGMYNLISGINTATKEQKAKMNLPAICKTMGIGMGAIGGVFLLAGVLTYFGLEWASIAAFAVLLFVIWYMLYYLQRYDGNNYREDGRPRKRYYAVITVVSLIMVAACVFVAVLFTITLKKPEVIFSPEEMEIHGMYGTELMKSEITEVRQVPPATLTSKTNGSAVFQAYKGHFMTEEYGPALLYANREGGDWIAISREKGDMILLSLKSPEETDALYAELCQWLGE